MSWFAEDTEEKPEDEDTMNATTGAVIIAIVIVWILIVTLSTWYFVFVNRTTENTGVTIVTK